MRSSLVGLIAVSLVAGLSRCWPDQEDPAPCPPNCLECNAVSNCTRCKDGFYVNKYESNNCSKCYTGCQQCTASSRCTVCDPDYYLEPSSYSPLEYVYCNRCPRFCHNCTANYTCGYCAQGYKMSQNQCYLEESRAGGFIIAGFLVAAVAVFGLLWKGCGFTNNEEEIDLTKYLQAAQPTDLVPQADPPKEAGPVDLT